MIAEPLVVRLVSGVVPTAPCSDTVPPVPPVSVSALAPLIVLPAPLKVMFAPPGVPVALVVSITVSAPRVVAPVTSTVPPAVVRLPFSVVAPV